MKKEVVKIANVIREDIIKVSHDVDITGLEKVNSDLSKLKTSVAGATSGIGGLDKLKKSFDGVKSSVSGIGNENSIKKLKNDIEVGSAYIDLAKDKFNQFKNTVKSISAHPIKTLDDKILGLQIGIGRTVTEFKRMGQEKFANIKSGLQNIKNTLTGGESGAKGFKNALSNIGKVGVAKVASGIQNIRSHISSSVPSAKEFVTKLKDIAKVGFDKLKSGLKNIGTQLSDIAKKAAGAAFNGLKKVASISFKAFAVGIGAAATAVGGLVGASVSAYANYEQLIGGVETLFKDSAGVVEKYANNAYKTAGLSANAYMETVTGFSASLLQSLGGDTAKAAKYGDMAITDMSDNANKMGTSMESIQYAYQGFAKQNFTIKSNSPMCA